MAESNKKATLPERRKRGRPPVAECPDYTELRAELVPLLLAGKSPARLARQYEVSAALLYGWRTSAHKKQKKEQKRQGLSIDLNAISPDKITDEEKIAVNQFIKNQGVSVIPTITDLRLSIGEILRKVHSTAESLIDRLASDVTKGTTIKTCWHKGELLQIPGKMDLDDYAKAANMLKQLSQELAELHCIPRGSIRINSLTESAPPVAAPTAHLHLHSHGSSAAPLVAVSAGSEGSTASIEVTNEGARRVSQARSIVETIDD